MSSSDSDEVGWVLDQSQALSAASQASHRRLSSSSSSIPLNFSDAEEDASEVKVEARAKARQGTPSPSAAKGGKRKGPASQLPLTLAPKVRRTTMLVEADDPSLDLSGDFGCIGRFGVRRRGAAAAASADADANGEEAEQEGTVKLDLKGRVYDGNIVPCNTLCLVSVDGSRAQVEAVFSDFVQLGTPRSTIFDMETVQHGEMGEGFFDDGEQDYFGSDSDEVQAPLKQKRGGGKLASKRPGKKKPVGKGKKAPAKKR